jgi:hypothetical protein
MLAHWDNSPRIDLLPHSDPLSWLRAKQYLLFLRNDALKKGNDKITELRTILVVVDIGTMSTVAGKCYMEMPTLFQRIIVP